MLKTHGIMTAMTIVILAAEAHATHSVVRVEGAWQAAATSLPRARLQDLDDLGGLGARLASISALSELSMLGNLAAISSLVDFSADLAESSVLEDLDLSTHGPRPPWVDQDPGDSLYRAARRLLNRGRYAEAGDVFAELAKRYPRSTYTPDSYYWAAFALYKTGDAGNYRLALTKLEFQRTHYPRAGTRGDARALAALINGQLARQGDPDAAVSIRTAAESAGRSPQSHCPANADDDDDPRIAALNALLQMDADAAVPILKQVLARRDACSVALRRKAVFIISQKRTSETEDILLAAARTDPDSEVREQAVFWLSQVGSERAIGALDSILRSTPDAEIQKKALFALSQIRSPRAGQLLREYAERSDAPAESREQAIFWLGQQRSSDNGTFLRALYGRLTDENLKEKVIFSLSQMRDEENARWLLDLALNEREPLEMRKKALFWAGQMGVALAQFAALYDRTTNQELKEQLIFVYSQRREPEAVEKLIDIAKHEPDRELRKKAVFWLGQSRDPRARQALLDIINQ